MSTATGREPVSMGKPATSYFDGVRSLHPDIKPERTLMIGDRLNTDIAFGNANKIKYTLLVGTGINTLDDARAATGDLRPSHYVSSLGNLFNL